jgi:hypothetical protein
MTMTTPNYEHLREVLLEWQDLRGSIPSRTPRALPSWEAARQLVDSAQAADTDAWKHLGEALHRSDERLAPLRDPLGFNLGDHRWLAADREESYSDWLAWILQGMKSASEILLLFGLPGRTVAGSLATSVTREEINDEGRTDVVVRFGDEHLLLIEVKTKPTGPGLADQLKRYTKWASNHFKGERSFVLLGLEEPAEDIEPFIFISWRTLCVGLRRLARLRKEGDLMSAAAILIFCGAAEQRLLGFSDERRRFRAMATVDYLNTWGEVDEPKAI